MSDHSLKIDVQEVAHCIKRIKVELDLIDHIFQQSLMEELSNATKDGRRETEGIEGQSSEG